MEQQVLPDTMISQVKTSRYKQQHGYRNHDDPHLDQETHLSRCSEPRCRLLSKALVSQ